MKIQKKAISAEGIKFFIEEEQGEVARAYFYVLTDDLNPEPVGLMREVYIKEQKEDYGKLLVQDIIKEARRMRCYKLICTSRHGSRMQNLLKKLGF